MNETITNILKQALKKMNIAPSEITIKNSNRPDLCDYQYDGTFTIAKEIHENPYEIGTKIVENLYLEPNINHYFQKIECVKPGFINFTLSDIYINELLTSIKNSPKFNITMPQKETIVIDYGGANIAKPLHIGHLRPAIVGESIKRILKYMNQEVIADVHLGDYGLQIGEVIYGLQEKNISPKEITLELLEKIYPKISALCKENEQIKEQCATITKELQENNPTYQEYFKNILEISKKDIKKIYDYLGVSFDLWLGESDAYKYISKVKEELLSLHLLKESENAKIIDVTEENDKKEIPPFIFQKSNQAYLYSTTDLATIYQRYQDYKPNKILYVVDIRQNLHFTQLFRVCQKIPQLKEIKYEFLGFGTINGSDNHPYKTRNGDIPKLEKFFEETKQIFINKKSENQELSSKDLDIITNAIIKYADLQNNREKDYIFDINKFSETTGKTGPNILYTYLRIAKILKTNQELVDRFNEKIYNIQDRELRIKILDLNNIMQQAYKTRCPSILANYLHELCNLLNTFYETNHINNLEDEYKKAEWVSLLTLTNQIIKKLLELLIIEIPSKM